MDHVRALSVNQRLHSMAPTTTTMAMTTTTSRVTAIGGQVYDDDDVDGDDDDDDKDDGACSQVCVYGAYGVYGYVFVHMYMYVFINIYMYIYIYICIWHSFHDPIQHRRTHNVHQWVVFFSTARSGLCTCNACICTPTCDGVYTPLGAVHTPPIRGYTLRVMVYTPPPPVPCTPQTPRRHIWDASPTMVCLGAS